MWKTFVQFAVFLNVLILVQSTKYYVNCPRKCKCNLHSAKEFVDCSRARLTSVPRIQNPSNVGYLNLKDNLIQTIPVSDFNGYSSLKKLDISGNPLKKIPKLTSDVLPKLTWLKVQTERLEADSFTRLKSLGTLCIYGSKSIQSIDRVMLQPLWLTLVHLEIHGTSVEQFPDLADFKGLRKLDLRDNQLKSLGNMPLGLSTVDISNNNLKALSLSNMTYLHNLNASYNQLETITLTNCLQIRNLDVSYNRLVELPKNMLESLKHLHRFNLANNLIEKVNITHCRMLSFIDLNFNHRLTSLHFEPQIWPKGGCTIKTLSIVQSNLTKLHVPDNIVIQNFNISFNCQLVDLQMEQVDHYKTYSIDWSSSCMDYLPYKEEVLGKHFRKRVDLHNNTLREVSSPEGGTVDYIDLSMNQLASVEFDLMDSNDFGTVDLSYNPNPTLKTYWFDMESSSYWGSNFLTLRSYSLKHNNLTSFPNLTQETGDTEVIIHALDLSYNHITSLNESVSKLIKRPGDLTDLNISYNKLSDFETSVFDILENLDLSHNQLSDGFTARIIHGLHKLKSLNLSFNNFDQIFTNRSHYHHNLVKIDLRYNQLTKAPLMNFEKWSSLKHLDLRMNSITEVPMEMLQQINSFYGGPKHRKLSLDVILSNVTYGEPIRRTEILLSGNPLQCDCTLILALDLGLLVPDDTCYGDISGSNSSSMLRISSLRKLIARSGHIPCKFCQFNVCHNRGECFPDKESGFKCKCHKGYLGDRCDKIDCLNSGLCHRCYDNFDYCQNGGECIQYVGNSYSRQCRCPDHYIGEICQHHVTKPCTTQQQQKCLCQNGGICQAGPLGNVSCACSRDFEGEFCELEKISGCDGSFCNQHGVCVFSEVIGKRKCICNEEWVGQNCDIQNASPPQKSTGLISSSNIGNIVLAILLVLAITALVFVTRRYKTKQSQEKIVHYRLHEDWDD